MIDGRVPGGKDKATGRAKTAQNSLIAQ